MCCVAIVVAMLSTRWGVATSSDSARYVRTARHILGTEAIVESDEPKHEQAHYPPFYPTMLAAAGMMTGRDPLAAARWLHVVIFAGNTLLTGLLAWRLSGRAWTAALAAGIVALSPVTVFMHAWLLSEALFILLSLVCLLLLSMHLERPRRALLIASAIAASLGMLTRYAGAATAPAAVAALFLLSHQPLRRRVIDAIVFCAVMFVLPGVWFLRNLHVGGSATNRTIAFHPISLEHLKDGVASVASWVLPFGIDRPRVSANTHPIIAALAVILFIAIFVGAIWMARRRRDRLGVGAGLLALFSVSFIALLAISISLVDFHTPADTRVLSPVFVAWVVLATCTLAWAAERVRKPARCIMIALVVIYAAICVWPSVETIRTLRRDGGGFAHAMWRKSPVIEAVRQLPPDLQIFTNAPGVVYLLTGRQMLLTVPSEISASSRLPNPEYPALMEKISAELSARRGVLVYLRKYGARRAYYPREDELQRRLGLHMLENRSDGAIYDLLAPPPTTTRAATAPAR